MDFGNEGTDQVGVESYEGPALTIGMSAKYLLAVLGKHTGPITLHASRPQRAILLYPTTEPRLLILQMPVMLPYTEA